MHTKKRTRGNVDGLRPEYDLTSLKGGVQGKYYTRATAGTTLVLLAADVAEAFPTGKAVNQALRALLRGRRPGRPNKALQPTSRAPRKAKPKPVVSRAARG
jgi:hypothetical protein